MVDRKKDSDRNSVLNDAEAQEKENELLGLDKDGKQKQPKNTNIEEPEQPYDVAPLNPAPSKPKRVFDEDEAGPKDGRPLDLGKDKDKDGTHGNKPTKDDKPSHKSAE